MLVRRLLGSLLILAASALACAAQTRPTARATHAIAGAVYDDADHHPMENIRVDLKDATGPLINTTFTRGNGEFEFSGLSNGDYVIEVVLKDYEATEQRVSVSGTDFRGVYVFLARPMTVVNTNSGGSISAHELSVPSKAHDEYEKAMNLMYGKLDYKGAIVQFQRAIKDFPSFYEAYAQEGNAYLQLGETEAAEGDMRKSVELSAGQYSRALFMLAGLLTETRRYSESETFARKGLAIDDNSWQGPFELAKALLGLQRLDDAEKSAVQARDMKPDNPSIYLLLANILIRRRDFPALVKDLDAYLKLVPSGADADQVRQERDNIKAELQKNEAQVQTSAGAPPPHPAPENDPPPPPEPDQSGLPSLPPPGSMN